MQKVIRDMLEGKMENHILPFFWQHGESEPILRETVAKIHEAHIRAVCVESRPHPDFLGESWWRDMDIIMDECKKRTMQNFLPDMLPGGLYGISRNTANGSSKKPILM